MGEEDRTRVPRSRKKKGPRVLAARLLSMARDVIAAYVEFNK